MEENIEGLEYKICCHCHRVLLISSFYYSNCAKRFNSRCKDCESQRAKEHYPKHRDKKLAYSKYYRETFTEKTNEAKYRWLKNNKEKRKETTKKYRQTHKKEHLADTRKREVAKLQAVPKWADLKAIKEFYKNCPKGYHVDHIIPLQNEFVCGLHVLENLQYLSSYENASKHNKFDFTLENTSWKNDL